MHYLKQFFHFGYLQALCCIFPAVIFLALALTQTFDINFIPRYDLILAICLIAQFLMVYSKLETVDELKVICLFHVIGLCLELFKVHMGSWSYPEEAYTKIGGVPLYSGFMYASVASYVCQAWRQFDLKFIGWPSPFLTYPLAVIIYLNFFTHHYFPDLRWLITASLPFLFWKAWVNLKLSSETYRMPIVLSFFLIGFFIWVAENIATFFGAWKYPQQTQKWEMVDFSKFSSWFLLIIITIIIVANLKHIKLERQKDDTSF